MEWSRRSYSREIQEDTSTAVQASGGASTEQSGAGLARERARRGSGVREAAERCGGGGAGD